MFRNKEFTIVVLGHGDAGLFADQQARQIVPNAVAVKVDPAVGGTLGYQTDVECRTTVGAKLRPPRPLLREPLDADYGLA